MSSDWWIYFSVVAEKLCQKDERLHSSLYPQDEIDQ